ncbi:hypothetical protein K1719_012882 [Acacia pycnantha]|nr:hypothetical protein K1719_012882 [Acacia pycnantha]
MDMQQGVSLNMDEKENLHPGENGVGRIGLKSMGIESRQSVGTDKVLTESLELLVWNNRGAVRKGFAAVVKDMKFRYNLDLVVNLEPRVSGSQASKIIKNWGFKHSVRMEVEGFSSGIWLVCPYEQKRRGLWEDFHEIAKNVTEPWLIAGDFNEIKTLLEQKGGGRWIEKFENAEVRVSPSLCSDHHPLLIKLEAKNQVYGKRSFRYEAMWQLHENCEEGMRQG